MNRFLFLKQSVLLVSLSLVSIHAQPLFSPEELAYVRNTACNWAEQCVTQLNQNETYIAANILYLLHANAIADQDARQLNTIITRTTQSIRTHVKKYEHANQEIAMLNQLLNDLNDVLLIRTALLTTVRHCENYCSQEQLTSLNNCLTQIQNHGQQLLCMWADKIEPEMSNFIKQVVNPLKQATENFQILSSFFAGISDGALPIHVEDQFKNLARFDIIKNTASEGSIYTDHLMNLFNDIHDSTQSIIMLGGEIYKEYYIALHNALTKQSNSGVQIPLMFNANGLLSMEEKIFLLPHPQEIEEYTKKIIYFSHNNI